MNGRRDNEAEKRMIKGEHTVNLRRYKRSAIRLYASLSASDLSCS